MLVIYCPFIKRKWRIKIESRGKKKWIIADYGREEDKQTETEESLSSGFSLYFVFEDLGDMFFRNVGWVWTDYTASLSRHLEEGKVDCKSVVLFALGVGGGGDEDKRSDTWNSSGSLVLLFRSHRASCVLYRKYGVRKTERPLAGWMTTDRFSWLDFTG
jgi:hypothetical protein